MDVGLLLARVTLGLLMAAHGSQKLFGWFGGHGLSATAGAFESLGFRPGRLMATMASTLEITSGLLLALGLLNPVAAALMVSVMIVAPAATAATRDPERPARLMIGSATSVCDAQIEPRRMADGVSMPIWVAPHHPMRKGKPKVRRPN